MYAQEPFDRICQEGQEVELFVLIDTLGELIFTTRRDMNRPIGELFFPANRRSEVFASIERAQEQSLQAVGYTKRFGVETPLTESGIGSEEYWSWYNWWHNYIRSVSEIQWKRIMQSLEDGSDVSRFRPQGDWRTATV